MGCVGISVKRSSAVYVQQKKSSMEIDNLQMDY